MTAKRKIHLILILSLIIILLSSCSSTKVEVADYENKINIWQNIPGNSQKSKLDEMNIDYNAIPLISLITFFNAIDGTEYKDQERDIDTYTYHREIKPGYENTTFTDEPYIIPYLVDESDIAVIVVPGGGYGYKAMDGDTGEARDIAIELNKKGFNAFVLHYRSNPYEYPIRELDLQRAIRFLKANAISFNINPDKIALIGFSAGGNLIGSFINEIVNNDYFPNTYEKDNTDTLDDSVIAAAMIYPVLTYEYNVGMLFASFDDEDVKNEETRKELLEITDLSKNFNSVNIPQFISYGTEDKVVNYQGTVNYIEAAEENNANITVVVAKKQNHGFKPKHYMKEFATWLNEIAEK